MSQQPTPAPNMEEARIILEQLGGREFLVMTGAKHLVGAGISEHNACPWLRLDLPSNQSGANRLKVTLLPSDTYRVEFYHQQLVQWEPVITREQTFEPVYAEDLRPLFTQVTGFDTHLPRIRFAA